MGVSRAPSQQRPSIDVSRRQGGPPHTAAPPLRTLLLPVPAVAGHAHRAGRLHLAQGKELGGPHVGGVGLVGLPQVEVDKEEEGQAVHLHTQHLIPAASCRGVGRIQWLQRGKADRQQGAEAASQAGRHAGASTQARPCPAAPRRAGLTIAALHQVSWLHHARQ